AGAAAGWTVRPRAGAPPGAGPPPDEPPLTTAAAAAAVPKPAPPPPPLAEPDPTPTEMFKTAATLATDFGRVRNLDELTRVLGRAAEVMDASGVMVWMGTPGGPELRPVLAHGYSAEMIAKIPAVPRSANNAAAAAFRSSTLQIVLSRPGNSTGAVVAPIMSPGGCVGALSAEIRHGAETSE